jgi:hypothetical protein
MAADQPAGPLPMITVLSGTSKIPAFYGMKDTQESCRSPPRRFRQIASAPGIAGRDRGLPLTAA